jgi:hypothetical protein
MQLVQIVGALAMGFLLLESVWTLVSAWSIYQLASGRSSTVSP